MLLADSELNRRARPAEAFCGTFHIEKARGDEHDFTTAKKGRCPTKLPPGHCHTSRRQPSRTEIRAQVPPMTLFGIDTPWRVFADTQGDARSPRGIHEAKWLAGEPGRLPAVARDGSLCTNKSTVDIEEALGFTRHIFRTPRFPCRNKDQWANGRRNGI